MTAPRIHFVLIGEGTSDEGLLPHLQTLCISEGAGEVTGVAPEFARLGERVGKKVADRVHAAIQLEPSANVIFVHRDADSRDSKPRYEEIESAFIASKLDTPWVAVVPVQETEAWLLADESRIRKAAFRPNGNQSLNLPAPASIEDAADPKGRLQTALIRASELTGRRLDRFKKQFPSQRKLLLEQLPVGGPLELLASWRRLRMDVAAAISAIADASAIAQVSNAED